jgi:maltose alpha-D-glucosyltransferase/alpha-amylase
MQWSPDRNGGFSRADFAQLYLPPLMDPVYGFESVNVEAQQRNPSSFLHWIRSILQTRKQFPVFGTGSFEVVPCANPSILAYVRSPQPLASETTISDRSAKNAKTGRAGRTGRPGRGNGRGDRDDGGSTNPVLCVHNLSRFAQPAQLDLARWADRSPVELLGRVPFPSVGAATYGVTLGPYGFYWFEMMDHDPVGHGQRPAGVPR